MQKVTAGGITRRESCERIRHEVRTLGAEIAASTDANTDAHNTAVRIIARRHGLREKVVRWCASPRTDLSRV
jgi:hypothetical protein